MFLNSHKNLLYTAIQDTKLNVRDFTFEASNQLLITHKASGFYFKIASQMVVPGNGGKEAPRLFTYSTPVISNVVILPNEEKRHVSIDKWDTVVHIFKEWLSWLKQETEQPDLWAQVEHEPYIFSDEEKITEDLFTAAEVKLLEARLSQIEQQIGDLNLPPEAEAAITDVVREVPTKAKRLTKKEVADIVIGSLMKEGLKWALTKENIISLWHICLHFFTLALPS